MSKNKKRSVIGTILKTIGIILAVLLVLVVGLLGFLSLTEYLPEANEPVNAEGHAAKTLSEGDTITLMSWNIGYGALGETSDFFMDGGSMVRAESKETVRTNLDAILSEIRSVKPDIVLLQETDRNSSRSFKIDEYAYLKDGLYDFQSAFANNYKVSYVPYPVPPLGTVDSGIATFSGFAINSSERVQLPVPFSWPVRTINLKRCLLVSRIPVEGSDRELVIVNLHLEAYDDGEGKLAQTKMLAELLIREAKAGNYVIAGGDFNQIFSSADASAYPCYGDNWAAPEIDVTQFGEGWSFLMDETVPSCRLLNMPYQGADADTFQYYLIDGFIVSENLRIETFETKDLGFVNSDHNPVVLSVTLS